MKNANHENDKDTNDLEGRFAAHRRLAVIAAARDAWTYFNRYRVNQGDSRFIGTSLAIISTIAGLASSATYLAGGIASRTAGSDSITGTVRLHNFTPYPLVMTSVRTSNSRVWASPVILSGQVEELPFTVSRFHFNHFNPGIDMSIVGEHGRIMNLGFSVLDRNGFIRVIEASFNNQRIQDQFITDNHRETGSVYYRGNPINGITPTIFTSTVTDGADCIVDVAILTRDSNASPA